MENNKEFKYNYILYNMESAYKWQMYKDLLSLDNVRMCRGALPFNEKFLHKLHKLHWSAKINKKINLPFKKLWFKKMTDGKFNNGKPTCFVLFGGQYAIRDPRFLDYIKKVDPRNKIAVHYRDMLKGDSKHISMLKEKTDLIYTYNESEVKEYGVEYFCSYIYSRSYDVTLPEEFEYDLYFIGYPKGRLDFLKKLCKHLTANKVRCLFKIAGVASEDRTPQEGITYLDKPIPYPQVEKELQNARCILELMQSESSGATLRTLEAISYKRRLLTNSPNVNKRELYCKDQMQEFNDIESIDIDFLTSPLPYERFLSVDSFSAVRELDYLEDYFTKI